MSFKSAACEYLFGSGEWPGQAEDARPAPPKPPPDQGLSPLEVSALATALEDCVDQLRILAFTEHKAPAEPEEEVLDLEERFGKPQRKPDAMEWISKGFPATEEPETPFTKVQKDRARAERAVQRVLDELLEAGSFSSLEEAVARAAEVRRLERQLLEDELADSGHVELLRRQLGEELLQKTAQIAQKEEQVARLKDEIQSTVYQAELEQQYLRRWEDSRSVQNSLRLERSEGDLQRRLETLQLQLARENSLHDEKHNFLLQELENTEKNLEYWMAKYYEDTDAKAEEVAQLKEKRRLNLKRLGELQLMLKAQGTEIAEYLAARERREQQEELERRSNAAATRIQSWWRGVMVRRGFGPFRKKRAKDKGKGKGKAKAKGKKPKK
ncbi:dynein regulatory complex protein 9 [Bacillus rossius redtenbacheri]|uniref:dynein regulatory complex protein 9 n=1 Tax=Bacillus rossius redtenbacheri TaxID=93214 RepID=UPI002FDF03E5